jgi:hypothetical protein
VPFLVPRGPFYISQPKRIAWLRHTKGRISAVISGFVRSPVLNLVKILVDELADNMVFGKHVEWPQLTKVGLAPYCGWNGKEPTSPSDVLERLEDQACNNLKEEVFTISLLARITSIRSCTWSIQVGKYLSERRAR